MDFSQFDFKETVPYSCSTEDAKACASLANSGKSRKVNKITDHFLPAKKKKEIYHINNYEHELRFLTPTPSHYKAALSILEILHIFADKLISELSTTSLKYRKELADERSGTSLPFGFNNRHVQGALTRNEPRAKNIITLAYMLLTLISPDSDYSAFSINKNRKFKKHFDSKNVKPSIIVSFGSFKKGGGLIVYDEWGRSKVFDIDRRFLVFDGKYLEHESDAWHGGDRFTLVFYKMTNTSGKNLETLSV